MVMGPGGYRFGDYWKLGLPLIVLFGVVAIAPRPGLLVVLRMDRRITSPPGTCPPGRAGRGARRPRRYERYRADTRRRELATSTPRSPRRRATCFGICVAGTSGRIFAVGDAEVEFTIMSVSKPFVFALVCQALGPERGAREARRQRHRAAVQLARGGRAERRRAHEPDGQLGRDRGDEPRPGRAPRRWEAIHDGLSALRRPRAAARTTRSTARRRRRTTATAARAPARALRARSTATRPRRSTSTPASARSNVTARDLAVMGATLADGGVNPLTRERVVDAGRLPLHARRDDDRRPVRDLGRLALRRRPARARAASAAGSSPSRPARAGSAPSRRALDAAGNSVKGQLAARFLSGAARASTCSRRGPRREQARRSLAGRASRLAALACRRSPAPR